MTIIDVARRAGASSGTVSRVLNHANVPPETLAHLGPALGADTDAVLGEAGYDAEALARLRAEGAVA